MGYEEGFIFLVSPIYTLTSLKRNLIYTHQEQEKKSCFICQEDMPSRIFTVRSEAQQAGGIQAAGTPHRKSIFFDSSGDFQSFPTWKRVVHPTFGISCYQEKARGREGLGLRVFFQWMKMQQREAQNSPRVAVRHIDTAAPAQRRWRSNVQPISGQLKLCLR